MRKALVVTAVMLLGAWLVLWVGALLLNNSVAQGAAHEWPLDLGTLSGVPGRYPATVMSDAADSLIDAAEPLGVDIAPRISGAPPQPRPLEFVRDQFGGWVISELRKPVETIEAMPSESAEYLSHRTAYLSVAAGILRANEPIVWDGDIGRPIVPMPNLLGHMQLHTLLVGRALDRARFGDRGAWHDLEAAWSLSRSLTSRPEVISNLIALAIARRVDAAARKMPVPAPGWFAQFQSFDFRRAMIAAYQADAWRINEHVYAETTIDASDEGFGPLARRAVDFVMAPYTRLSASDLAEQWRRSAVEIAKTRECAFDAKIFSQRRRASIPWWNLPAKQLDTPNVDEIWARVLRFGVEREATVRVLALRAGSPPQQSSSCSDGQWIYRADGRGFTFSKTLPDPPVPASAMPVEFSLSAVPATSP